MAVLVALVFAGCAGGATKTIPTTAAPPPVVTADTGSIVGVVIDESVRPISGVRVALVEVALEATTDDAGLFTINDVAPGAYTLIADRLGYESQAKKVNVLAGEATDARFTLKEIPIVTSRLQSWQHVGFIKAALGAVAATSHVNQTGENFLDWYIKIAPGVVSASTGLRWTANTATSAKWMYHSIWLTKNACADLCQRINYTYGRSPLVTRADDLEVDGKGFEINAYFLLGAPCGISTAPCQTTDADALLQVAFEQKFDIFMTVSFLDPLPIGFNPVPK